MLLELFYLFLLIILYFIVAYIMVILYEKGVSTFQIRLFLIFALIAYIYLAHKDNNIWSNSEICVILVIFLAHIFTINRNTLNSKKPHLKKDDMDIEEAHERNRSVHEWILNFIFLAWLFDDDDDHWLF